MPLIGTVQRRSIRRGYTQSLQSHLVQATRMASMKARVPLRSYSAHGCKKPRRRTGLVVYGIKLAKWLCGSCSFPLPAPAQNSHHSQAGGEKWEGGRKGDWTESDIVHIDLGTRVSENAKFASRR